MTRNELIADLTADYQDELRKTEKAGQRCEIYGLGDLSKEWSIKPPFDKKLSLTDMSYDDLYVVFRECEMMKDALENFMDALDYLIDAKRSLEHSDDYECDDDE